MTFYLTNEQGLYLESFEKSYGALMTNWGGDKSRAVSFSTREKALYFRTKFDLFDCEIKEA